MQSPRFGEKIRSRIVVDSAPESLLWVYGTSEAMNTMTKLCWWYPT